MLETSSAKAERSSIGVARTGVAARALQKVRLCIMKSSRLIHARLVTQSGLHAPALDCSGLDEAKHHVLDREPDQDDGEQAGKHFRNVELIFAFEDVPAEPALARRHAEYELSLI